MEGTGGNEEAPEHIRRSVFDEYGRTAEAGPGDVTDAAPDRRSAGAAARADTVPPETSPEVPPGARPVAEDPEVAARRRESAELLGEFRRTAVLVPLEDGPGPETERGLLTADFNGIRFLLAFSDEQALARYAQARGETARTWTYRTVLGAKLLDGAVPAAGVPCGVALDCADGPEGGTVFPPVRGIVPDGAAVDTDVRDDAADDVREGDHA